MALIEKFLDLEKKPVDKTSKEVLATTKDKKVAEFFVRTLGNARVSAEAQRIYNPTLPATNPKGPTEAQTELGTASNMDMQGNWGTPAEK